MLSYLILVVLQFAAAFLGAPSVLAMVPVSGDLRLFVHAAIYAVIVWLVGLLGSLVLKDVRQPGTSSLALALILALAGAAVIVFAPQILSLIPLKFPPLYLPLAGAIIGYLLRR
ncbi:MAG: hypothetical protein ACRCS9_12045 [Hyphomicrobium sp.]